MAFLAIGCGIHDITGIAKGCDQLAVNVGIVLNNVRDVMPYYYNYEHYGYISDDEPHTVVSGDKA